MMYTAKLTATVDLVKNGVTTPVKIDDQMTATVATPNSADVEVTGKVVGIQLGAALPASNQYGPMYDGINTSVYNSDKMGNFRDASSYYAPDAFMLEVEAEEEGEDPEYVYVAVDKIKEVSNEGGGEDGGTSGGEITPLLSFSGNTSEIADQSDLFHIKHISGANSGSYDLAYADLGTVATADLEDGVFIYFDQPGTYVFGMAESEYGPGYTFNGNGRPSEISMNFHIVDGTVMFSYSFDPEDEGEDVAIGSLKTQLRGANQDISFKIYKLADLEQG